MCVCVYTFGAKVLHDGRRVHGGRGTDTLLRVHASLQETVDTTDGELEAGTAGSRLGRALVVGGLSSLSSLASLSALSSLAACDLHFCCWWLLLAVVW